MKAYYSDPQLNKAAMILASFSPDIVRDIVRLALMHGNALPTSLFTESVGVLRPGAIVSRNYIADEDFPELWTGLTTLQLYSMKSLQGDNDFYKAVIKATFDVPDAMAESISKSIETLDSVGGGSGGGWLSWANRVKAKISEVTRTTANWAASVLPFNWENDQTQKYDIDFLYEVASLGRAVDKLMQRARLSAGQAAISSGMHLFQTGDIEDQYGDAELDAAAAFGDVIAPLVRPKLPDEMYGNMAPLVNAGRGAALTGTVKALADAGMHPAIQPSRGGGSPDFNLANAIEGMQTGDTSSKGGLASLLTLIPGIGPLIGLLAKLGKGDVDGSDDLALLAGDVAHKYGPEAGHAIARGDLQGCLQAIADQADDEDASTGDPDIDRDIIANTLDQISVEEGRQVGLGDIDDDGAEVGGLFRRARIKHALNKGRRVRRRATRKQNRAIRRRNKDADLARAQQYKDEVVDDYTTEGYEPVDDSGGEMDPYNQGPGGEQDLGDGTFMA